uniref:Uncharacterized protein n=1 Tax=Arundo donax TaxID=35708 RepID=A0A0A8Y7A6_ARUDO
MLHFMEEPVPIVDQPGVAACAEQPQKCDIIGRDRCILHPVEQLQCLPCHSIL